MEKRKSAVPIKAVVFDLDGTLVDSLADIAAAVNATLLDHGRRPHPLEAYQAMVGWGLKQLLVTASSDHPLGPRELEEAYQGVLTRYRAHPVAQTRAYSGIATLLSGLSGRIPLGVLSNKEDGMTKTIVSTLFPDVAFGLVWGARLGTPHKPDPTALVEMLEGWGIEPEHCAYLGDSEVDMETATRAGAIACGASWGFRTEDQLRASGAYEVFPEPSVFGSWLEPRLERN